MACALRAQRHISFYVYEYAIGLNMDAPVKEPANQKTKAKSILVLLSL